MDELAIKIEHVSKEYRLGTIGGGTLRGDLQSWWARLRGKEDPNSKIGSAATHSTSRGRWLPKTRLQRQDWRVANFTELVQELAARCG